jgi:SAM-dependent methyltransferase
VERRAGEHLEASLIMDNNWEELYRTGETPWEKGKAHPELVAFLRRQPLNGRVLVPGCGHGHDVRAIAACADEVVGLDIAEGAIAAAENYPVVGGERFVLGDLFALSPRWRGQFDWVFEHTCFCAIDPEMRLAYVDAVSSALRPGGHLLAIFYMNPDMDPGETGPPFGSTKEDLDALFAPAFDFLGEWIPAETFSGREQRELVRVLRRHT